MTLPREVRPVHTGKLRYLHGSSPMLSLQIVTIPLHPVRLGCIRFFGANSACSRTGATYGKRIVAVRQRDIYRSARAASAAAMPLTARQAEVLRLAGRGMSGKRIRPPSRGYQSAPLRITSAECGGAQARAARAN